MPRRQRDYAAEYRRAKERATRAGYQSERQYKRARKALDLPRNAPIIPVGIAAPKAAPAEPAYAAEMRRLRREAKRWSDRHSRVGNSRYRPSMTDDQVRRYHRAFVEPPPGSPRGKPYKRAKLARIRDYLVPDILDDREWDGKYATV